MESADYARLDDTGLIGVEGADAVPFLHAQLTSDVSHLAAARTQYSGYCTPQGRLLATFLLWRLDDRVYLQLPRALRESVQTRLTKYVLRSRVALRDATQAHALVGVWGERAGDAIAALVGAVPAVLHDVTIAAEVAVTRLGASRFVVMAPSARADEVLDKLGDVAQAQLPGAWALTEIEAGIPVITPPVQEKYVPQMVNLDAIGGVSYDKGCYPGQEIVARTHFLGRLKQRMYRVHVSGVEPPAPGDPLYSTAFGAEQASGNILATEADPAGGHAALAVLQLAAASGPVHWKSPDGPQVAIEQVPYPLP